MFKVIIGFLLIAISVVLLLQIDDELNPDIERFLALSTVADTSEAYFYLMGLDANEDENPSETGRRHFESMKQNNPHSTGNENEGFPETVDERKLALPSGERFCTIWKEDCIETIFSNKDDLEPILLSNGTLLNRYQTFINMTDYHTLAKPTISEILPAYHYLAKGNRLVILKAVQTAKTSDPVQAISLLMDNMSALRQHLTSADNLVGKMMYAILISENIDVISIFIHQQNTIFEDEIAPISLSERNFETAMAREFALMYDLFSNLDKNSEYFAHTGLENQVKAHGWLVKTVFKPNISINETFLMYKSIAARSQLEQYDFAGLVLENDNQLPFQIATMRNYAGSIVNNIATPDFDKYLARLFDLNAKIALFNQTSGKTQLLDDLNAIQNPYYQGSGTAYYSKNGKNICLTGPLEDNRNLRCLRIKM